MSFSGPQLPPPAPSPNPYAVAAAQTAANISTAIVNAKMQNADEETPEAYVTYSDNGTYSLDDPQYSSSGTLGSTTTRSIPLFKRVITLKPTQQAIFDANNAAKLLLAQTSNAQLVQIQSALSTPFTTDVLPAGSDAPSAQTFTMSVSDPGSMVRTIGSTDLTTYLETIRQAILYRPNIKLNYDRDQLIAKLANQGIIAGMDAYDREMQMFDWRANDQEQQAYLNSMQEATRRVSLEQLIAAFANDATRRTADKDILIGQFANQASIQRFSMLHSIADFINTIRTRKMQELLAERSTALNETSVLLHGGTVTIPQFEGFRPGHVSDTPIGQYIYQSAALDQQKYQSVVQQAQFAQQRRDEIIGGIMGAAGGIAGAAIGAPPGSAGSRLLGGA